MDQAEGMQQNIAPSEVAAPQEASTEKMLKQSEVNELVGRIKHDLVIYQIRIGNYTGVAIS